MVKFRIPHGEILALLQRVSWRRHIDGGRILSVKKAYPPSPKAESPMELTDEGMVLGEMVTDERSESRRAQSYARQGEPGPPPNIDGLNQIRGLRDEFRLVSAGNTAEYWRS